MVLETVKVEWLEKRPYIAIFLGIVYTFIAYAFAIIFYEAKASVVMLFLTTLLLIPSLMKLINLEEKRESREGVRNFFHNHKDIIEVYIFLSIGIFLGFLVLGFLVNDSNSVFEFQIDFLKGQEGLSSELIENFLENPLEPSINQVVGILNNNLTVNIICFVLSFFYGAGAIFLIVMNASIFASFILFVIRYLSETASHAASILGIFMIHLVPEISGFLLAAIAGGVVSKAVMSEKIGSNGFKNVVRDAMFLLILSCVLIVIAAFLEVYATTNLIYSLF